jgi:uncharacterized protein YndB with AHSA1/START domain
LHCSAELGEKSVSQLRAEILPVEFSDSAAVRIVINASPSVIFDIVADPSKHPLFDGSDSVKALLRGPSRLFLGAKFGMKMKIKVPYWITNTVVDFDENSKISWAHLMKWRWSYELVDLGAGKTQVTEHFDAHHIPKLAHVWLDFTGAMKYNPKAMAKSLVKLKVLCEGRG